MQLIPLGMGRRRKQLNVLAAVLDFCFCFTKQLQIYFSFIWRQLQYWILIGNLVFASSLGCLCWFPDTPVEKYKGCLPCAGWGEVGDTSWEQLLSAAEKALGTRRGLSLLFPLSSIWKTTGSFPIPRGNTEVVFDTLLMRPPWAKWKWCHSSLHWCSWEVLKMCWRASFGRELLLVLSELPVGGVWWSAFLSEALQSRLALPLESESGQGLFLPVQGGIFSWLLLQGIGFGDDPSSQSSSSGCPAVERSLFFLLERSCGSPSCCSAGWDAGWDRCSKQQILHGWVSHCGRHCEVLWEQNQLNFCVFSVGAL